jgi:anti-anti-sigma factor
LRAELIDVIARGATSIVVDLSKVTSIDSEGLRTLVDAARRLEELKRPFAVVCPREDLRRIFEATGADTVIPVHDALPEVVGRNLLTEALAKRVAEVRSRFRVA